MYVCVVFMYVCTYVCIASYVCMYVCMYVRICIIPLSAGGSKGTAEQYILYCPLQRAIYILNFQILPGKVVYSNPLNHSLIQSFCIFDPNTACLDCICIVDMIPLYSEPYGI